VRHRVPSHFNCSPMTNVPLHIHGSLVRNPAGIPDSLTHRSCVQSQVNNARDISASSEANSSLASPEIPCILWNPKVHCQIHKGEPPLRILSHIKPLTAPSLAYFLNINLNIILPSMPSSSKWFLSLAFPHQNPVYTSTLPIRATCLAHPILIDFYQPNNIW